MSKRNQSITLFVASLACFMVILDTTVVNVAINGVRESLNASLDGLQWVIDGYALSFASLLLSAGALSDRFGPRRAFVFGLAEFGVTSLLCGIAPNLSVLVVARIAQGIGAALLIPSSLALLSRAFTVPLERVRALSVWGGIGGGAAMTFGPVLGGLLTGGLGWRSVFLINVPVGICALLLMRFLPSEGTTSQKRSLDLPGQLAAVTGLAALTYLFIEGPSLGWTSTPAMSAAAISFLCGVAFVWIETVTPDPMLPLPLFRRRAFSMSASVGFALNFAFYGQLFFLNVFLQTQSGVSAQAAGLKFLPEAAAGVTFAFLAGRLAHRIAPAISVGLGTLISTFGLFALAAAGFRGNGLVDVLCLLAIGVSIGTPASLVSVMLAGVETKQAGLAGGVLNAGRQVGGLLGVAVLGAIVGHNAGPGAREALYISAGVMALASLGAFYLSRAAAPAYSYSFASEHAELERLEAIAEAVA